MSEMPINLYSLTDGWNSVDKVSKVQMEAIMQRIGKLAQLFDQATWLGIANKEGKWGSDTESDELWNLYDPGDNYHPLDAASGTFQFSDVPALTPKQACSLYALMTGEELCQQTKQKRGGVSCGMHWGMLVGRKTHGGVKVVFLFLSYKIDTKTFYALPPPFLATSAPTSLCASIRTHG